jgi:hypothetical protein
MHTLSILIVAAAFSSEPAPPEAPGRPVYEGPAIAEMPPRSVDVLRSSYRDAMRRAGDRNLPDPYVLVPELVEIYLALERPAGLAHSEAAGMRRAVKLRLETFRDRLMRDRREEEKAVAREARRNTKPRVRTAEPAADHADSKQSLAGGGAIAARAQELIDLIQNTIEPDSWDVNGGGGTIRFFPQLNVLVIRNTGEVHYEVGGALDVLRK